MDAVGYCVDLCTGCRLEGIVMSRKDYSKEMVQRGREFRLAFQMIVNFLGHVDSCSSCSEKWDHIRKHASEDNYD